MIQQQGWFSTYDLCILETEQKIKHYSINVSCDRNLKAFFHISNRQTVEWNLNQWNPTLKYSIPPTHLKRMAPIENSEGHGYMADHRPGPAASIKLNLKGKIKMALIIIIGQTSINFKLIWGHGIYETYIKLEQVNSAKVKYSDYDLTWNIFTP